MAKPYQNIDYLSHLCGSFTGAAGAVMINKGWHLRQGKPALKDNTKDTPIYI